MIIRFIKFWIVGFSGMVIDFSITILLKEKFRIHRYLASSAGFITAASSNYLFNRLWTFKSHNPHIGKEYALFLLVSVGGLAINNFFLWIAEKKFTFYPSKVIATLASVGWNFLANYYFTFHL